MRQFKHFFLLALSAGLALGCADTATGGPDSGLIGQPIATAEAGLVAFEQCSDLDSYVRGVAVAELDKAIEYVQKGEFPPFAGGGPSVAVNDLAAGGNGEERSSAGAPQVGSSSGDAPAYSETNVQVAGVDEADLVKTDGNYIYLANGSGLRILKSHPADETALVAELEIPGAATDLFLDGDKLLIYGRTWGNAEAPTIFPQGGGSGVSISGSTGSGSTGSMGTGDTPSAPPAIPSAEPTDSSEPDSDSDDEPASKPGADATVLDELRGNVTVITVVDITDRTAPVITRTIHVEGHTVAARKVGSRVYTVLGGQLFLESVSTMGSIGSSVGSPTVSISNPGMPTEVEVEPPTEPSDSSGPSEGTDPGEDTDNGGTDDEPDSGKADVVEPLLTEDQIAELKSLYLAGLQSQSLDDWMPRMADSKTGDVTPMTACGAFYKPTIQLGLNTVTVLTVDLGSADADVQATTTLGRVDTVYATAEALYAASYTYGYWFHDDVADKDGGEYTLVHKFSIGEAGSSYVASGKVAGRVLNQFSMDEFEGRLRLATNTRSWTDNTQSSGVYVMETTDGGLEVVGKLEGLAEGEDIYSARFIGNRGFVVTFERIDPLFTLDLSDPTAPKQVGELKIPGFSTYIHPLGDNHLLTIGRETFDNGDWVEVQGVKVQIFDVTDMANPNVASELHLKDSGANSEALYDHRAFSFFADKGILALPFSFYDQMDSGQHAGVAVLNVSATDGISLKGEVSHDDFVTSDNDWDRWTNQVRRCLNIGDALYSIGTLGLKVSALSDLSELASVVLPFDSGGDAKGVPQPGIPSRQGGDEGDSTDPAPEEEPSGDEPGSDQP